MKKAILEGRSFLESEATAKHAAWFDTFKDSYSFTEDNTEDIIKSEIGKTFVKVLKDAGVYKRTPEGQAAFLRFIDAVNE